MRPDITVGSTFPDYELLDQTDTMRKLSVLQGINETNPSTDGKRNGSV